MRDEMHLIVNPDRSDAAAEIDDLADDVEHPGSASELADAAERAADADVVAAVGGDGTQRTVAEVLADADGSGPADSRPTSLLVVPAGTVNLLGRLHGIETVGDARRALIDGEERRLDLGRCNGEPFLLNASTGYDADVMASLDDRVKRFGRLGIGVVGALHLVRATSRRCQVRIDGRDAYDGSALTVLVMNVAYRGSTTRALVPEASADDGRLHVLVFTGRRAIVRSVWSLLRGAPHGADGVVTGDGTRIDVEWDEEVAEQRDGDAVGTGRWFSYEVEPGAVSLRVPRST